jgi:hypothetical protein
MQLAFVTVRFSDGRVRSILCMAGKFLTDPERWPW